MILPLVGGPLAEHGLGGATDLPIPFLYAMVGASWALTASFAVLALAWKEPRYTVPGAAGPGTPAGPGAAGPGTPVGPGAAGPGTPVGPGAAGPGTPAGPGAAGPGTPVGRRPWLGVVGLVVTAWVYLALYGGPATDENAALGAFYVLVWVGLVPLALLLGHVWRDLSPWRTVQTVVGRLTGRPDGFVAYPRGLGYAPAVVGLLAFAWMELASPDPGSVPAVRTWVTVYTVVVLLGGIVFGPRWFDRADPFDVYSGVVAHLSPFVRDGRRDLHDPLRTLPTIPVERGLVALLATLLGSTAYDSFSASSFWQGKTLSVTQHSITLSCFVAVVGSLFWLAARATGGVTRQERRLLPGLLAHSLAPIVVGYVFAHYLSYLVEKGQTALFALQDPLGRGWHPLGHPTTSYWLSEHTALLAGIKVTFVVIGHVVAVVAAHDRALAILPRAHRLTGQLAMLVLMVVYTFSGLYLLFSA